MNRLTLKLLVLLSVLPVLLGADQPAKKPKPLSPIRRIQKLSYDFKDAGKEMEYGLFVPSSYESEPEARKLFPLVVALHGLGSNPQQILHYPGLVN